MLYNYKRISCSIGGHSKVVNIPPPQTNTRDTEFCLHIVQFIFNIVIISMKVCVSLLWVLMIFFYNHGLRQIHMHVSLFLPLFLFPLQFLYVKSI
jgi:hypothetical protein